MSKRGKTICAGSFADYDAKLESGEWSQAQYDEFFTEARMHGLKGNIYPFAVGGSDSGAIMGVSKFTTKRMIQKEKLQQGKRTINEKTQYLFDYGHIFEDAVGKMCTLNLSETLDLPLKFVPCQDEYVNEAWPHFLAHPDGFIMNGDELFALAEVKTVSAWGTSWEEFKQGEIPKEYYCQVQCYMHILGINKCYLLANDRNGQKENFVALEIEADADFAEMVLDECEQFVEDTVNGIVFSSKEAGSRIDIVKDENSALYGIKVPGAPSEVMLDKSSVSRFNSLQKIDDEIKALKDLMKADEEALKQKYKQENQRIKNLEEEKDKILNDFVEDINIADKGVLKTEDAIYSVDLKRDFSFNAGVKRYFQNTYPDVWEDISTKEPNLKVSWKKKVIKNAKA